MHEYFIDKFLCSSLASMEASTSGQEELPADEHEFSEIWSEADSDSDDTETEHINSDHTDSQTSGEDDVSEPVTKIPDEFQKPLYERATISVCATYCAIMEFASSARLPYSTIEKLLQLLRLPCPPDSRLPTSMYKLKCFFRMFNSVYQKDEFCSGCGQKLPANHSCPLGQKTNVIVSLPLQKSIQSLIQSEFVARLTQYIGVASFSVK